MLLVVDLSQDCGSIVLHASFDANPLPPLSSCPVSIFILYVLLAAVGLVLVDEIKSSLSKVIVKI